MRGGTALAAAMLLVAGAGALRAADGLDGRERRIVSAAAAEEGRAVALLEELVNINSGTFNLAGVKQVGEAMRRELEPLGFEVEWVAMEAFGRAGHLLARHKGNGKGRRILLIGHLDTVFEKDSPFQRFTRRGTVGEGPGVNDMKDGLAIMVASLRALAQAGALKDADIRIVLSGDEERPGRPLSSARAHMIQAARASDVALEFEGLAQENGRDMGSISRRGSSSWTIKVTAKSGHSLGIFSPEAGYGAAYELARILDAFRGELPERYLTYNVGYALAGAAIEVNADQTGGTASGKTNIIPATAVARGDIRTIDNAQLARTRAKMRAIVARSLPGTQVAIEFEDGYPAMPPTAGGRALLAELNGVNRALGLAPMEELDPMKRGAGDISVVADRVDGIIGFGAAGRGSHAPGETVDLTSFERQIKRTALFLHRLSKPPPPGR